MPAEDSERIADYMIEVMDNSEVGAWITPLGVDASLDALVEVPERVSGGSLDQYRIADIGCGTGVLTERLAEQYPTAEIRAVDISSRSVEAAEERVENAENASVEKADALEYLSGRPAFDFVYAVNSVQDMENPVKTIESVHESIVDDGYFLMTVPNDDVLAQFPDEYQGWDENVSLPRIEIGPVTIDGKEMSYAQYLFPRDRTRKILSTAGFSLKEETQLEADPSGVPIILNEFGITIDGAPSGVATVDQYLAQK